MKIDLEQAGTSAQQEVPKAAPSAAAQLEAAQNPLKKDQPAEMLSPQVIALMNEQTARAVREAVGLILEKFLPTFEKLSAPSPKELADQAEETKAKKRNAREWESQKTQLAETRRAEKSKQEQCSHLDGNGHSRLNVVHNFPDHQPRAFCTGCGIWVHPKEYRTAPPSVTTLSQAETFICELEKQGEPAGITAYFDSAQAKVSHFLYPAHKLFGLVQQLESKNAMGVI